MRGEIDKQVVAERVVLDEIIKGKVESQHVGDNVLPLFLQGRGIKLEGEDVMEYKEQPWHRLAAQMYAFGYNNGEIAKELDKNYQTVKNLIKRREFQAMVNTIIEERGIGKDLMEQVKTEAIASLQTLVELRDNPKVSASVRANIAMNILERNLGKVPQKLEHSGEIRTGDPVAEIERLKQQNTELLREHGPSIN